MRIARKKLSQRITNASFAFILALSSVTASLPFVASQKVSAVPATVVYDSLASVSPDTNYPSSGVQAHNYNELGDRIILSDDSQVLKTASITMSSWALKSTAANVTWCDGHPGKCTDEGFSYPMTLKAYKSDLTPIGSSTVEIFIPWRPEGDPSCGSTSNGTNKGWKVGEVCYNFGGKAFNAVLDVSSANITVPQDVVLGFAYNTQTKGYAPTGETGPINSINIAYPNTTASIGTDQNTNEAYVSTNAPATWGVVGTSFQTTDFGPGYGFGIRVTAESDIPETTLNVKTGNSNSVNALVAGAIGDKFTVSGVATDNNDLSRVYVQLNKSTGGRFGGTTVHLNGTSDDWSVAYDASNLGFVNGDKVRAHVSVTDTTGKTKSVGWTDWMTVDTTKPVVTGSTEPTFNPSSITISATDSGVGISKVTGNLYNDDTNTLIHGNSSTTQNPFTVSLDNLNDGNYYVRYNASDKAGNVSNTNEFHFVVDKTAPTAPLITKPTARQWFKTTPIATTWSVAADSNGIDHYQIAYHYDDDHSFGGSTCAGEEISGVTLSGCRNVAGTSRNHVPGLTEEGGVTIWVRAIDNAGNIGPWSSSVHYYYDHSNPTISMSVPVGIVGNDFTVSGDAADNEGLNRVYLQLNKSTGGRYGGTTIHMITNPFSLTKSWSHAFDAQALGLVDGDYRAHASVTDMAGNSSDTGWSNYFTVDTIKPTVEITSPTANLTNGDVEVRATVTDANLRHYWLQIKKNGTVVKSQTVLSSGITNKLLQTLTEDGVYTITIAARDLAGGTANSGNRSDDVVKTVTIDKTAPSTPVATYSGSGTQSVTLNTEDNTDDIFYTIDGSAETLYTGPFALTQGLGFSAVARDTAGNESAPLVAGAPVITNEASITPTTNSLVLQWTTDEATTSRVIYDIVSHSTLDNNDVNFGYAFSTVEDPNKVTNHSVLVTGLTAGTTYYFRTVSHGSPVAVSDEVNGTTSKIVPAGTNSDNVPVFRVTSNNDSEVADDSQAAEKGEVLAAQDANKNFAATNTIEKSKDGTWNIFGLAWYWWLLILVLLGGAAWGLIRRVRQNNA